VEAGRERIEVVLAADGSAPRQARRLVGEATATLPGDLGFRARLATSELVANSVTHAPTAGDESVELTVVPTGSGVRVEVRDRGAPFDPAARQVSEQATSGRGLGLVNVLVDRWGVVREPEGNLAWFEIDQPAGGDQAPHRRPPSGATRRRPRTEPDPEPADEQTLAAAVLARATRRIREGWCQHTEARDMAGTPVEPWSEQAAAWSLLGALVSALDGPVATPDVPLPALADAMSALATLVDDDSLSGWNDAPGRTQQDVIAVLERARMLIRAGRATA
jgi:anti-sigma regulatory factor (Ser/Thr protein kinase)